MGGTWQTHRTWETPVPGVRNFQSPLDNQSWDEDHSAGFPREGTWEQRATPPKGLLSGAGPCSTSCLVYSEMQSKHCSVVSLRTSNCIILNPSTFTINPGAATDSVLWGTGLSNKARGSPARMVRAAKSMRRPPNSCLHVTDVVGKLCQKHVVGPLPRFSEDPSEAVL